MRKQLMIASALTVGGMALLGWLALERLPTGATLPVHWGLDGRPDRVESAARALFELPAVAFGLSLLMAALPSLEPLGRKLEGSLPLYGTAWATMLGALAVMQLAVAGPAFGWAVPAALPLVVVGIVLIALGDALPKSRPNFFVGIRTPWTITDPENWIATHRYASRIIAAVGLGIVVVALLPIDAEARGSLVDAAILVMTVTPVLYSYLFWRRSRRA